MRCRHCGHEIPEGMLYCEQCGEEVCIVPDYNPLDDMLSAQIKGEIPEGYEMFAGSIQMDKHNTATGRNTAKRNTAGRNTARKNTTGRMASEKEQRRRQMERKKALRRKRRNLLLIIFAVLVAVAASVSIVIYRTSYTGIVNKGYKLLESKEYDQAVSSFQQAIAKKPSSAEAYTGLSKVYLAQGDSDQAENVFLSAIETYPESSLYEACIQFYMDTDQKMEIPLFLEDAEDEIRSSLGGYIIEQPEFSLDDTEVYDDVQELSLTSSEKTIYYTTDGSNPTTESTLYAEPIHLGEDQTVITAIAVNAKGVPSLPLQKIYTVELPIEDAPIVSPSTGQYDTATPIEIRVPEGYTAYYTMDRSDPTTASSLYEGPIDMPGGETLFKAILVNAKGRTSGITTRNYLLEISE